MTICIAAYGSCAGKAVLSALAAVESVASGAIGGFVSAVAMDDHQCFRAETQNGGVDQLEYMRCRTTFENAYIAGLISSGPNRPAPLSAFLPAEPGVGLVTGHRSPSIVCDSGEPLNLQILNNLKAGMSSYEAVDTIVSANPEADAGFVAMNCEGIAYAGNTPEVQRRPDIGIARLIRQSASVLTMHNAIRPIKPLAELAANIAMETLCPQFTDIKTAYLFQGCEVIEGPETAIYIDNEFQVTRIIVTQSLRNKQNELNIALNLGYQPTVYVEKYQIGFLIHEPYLLISNGQLYSANGQSFIELSVGCTFNTAD